MLEQYKLKINHIFYLNYFSEKFEIFREIYLLCGLTHLIFRFSLNITAINGLSLAGASKNVLNLEIAEKEKSKHQH